MARKENKPLGPMAKVIEDGLQGIQETSCVLARIWRIILYETGLTGNQWHTQLAKLAASSKTKYTDKDANSFAGNITRKLAKNDITWKALIQGLRILEYERMDIHITLWKRGKKREILVKLNDLTKEGELHDDEHDEK